jgi:hypothetical protein
MGVSEFAVHNVLRTYSRQEQLGRAQRAKVRGVTLARTSDQVSLSPTGQKVQWVGNFAAQLVDRQNQDLAPEERAWRIRDTKDDLLDRHRDELGNDAESPGAFEARLASIYLG